VVRPILARFGKNVGIDQIALRHCRMSTSRPVSLSCSTLKSSNFGPPSNNSRRSG
jgi:hypothetical protein